MKRDDYRARAATNDIVRGFAMALVGMQALGASDRMLAAVEKIEGAVHRMVRRKITAELAEELEVPL